MAIRRAGGSTVAGKKYNSTAVDSNFFTATGGTITTSGNLRIHTFTSDGTFTFSTSTKASGYRYYSDSGLKFDYLVVAGGAGASSGYNGYGAGGGGAGGLRSSINPTGGSANPEYNAPVIPGGNYSVTIGGGGNAGTNVYPSTPFEGTNGNNSIFGSITSTGGGLGAFYGNTGASGGSGGGGAAANTSSGGSGTTGQGFAGGGVISGAGYYGGGGGGGAGSVGSGNTTSGTGQPGGNGVANTISGSSVTYAAGGRGGYSGTTGNNPSAGGTNTGNGGGGGTGGNPGGGGATGGAAGGSGIVVVRYSTSI